MDVRLSEAVQKDYHALEWHHPLPIQTTVVFLDSLRRTHLHGSNVTPTLLMCTGQEASAHGGL